MPPTEIHDVTSASGPWRLRVEAAGSFLTHGISPKPETVLEIWKRTAAKNLIRNRPRCFQSSTVCRAVHWRGITMLAVCWMCLRKEKDGKEGAKERFFSGLSYYGE